MKFLERELSGLPPVIQQASLLQLECAIREIHGRLTIHDTTIDDFTLHRLCGKIYGVVDFIQKFKRVLEEAETASDETPQT